jgi:VanZ family protein
MSPMTPTNQPSSQAPWLWWCAIALYYPAICLGHLQFSLWLVRGRTLTWGGTTYVYAYSYAVPWLAGIGVATLAWLLWRQVRRAVRPWPALVYWCLWALAVVLVDRTLTYSANEYAHYPQYALLAWMLAHVLDPNRQRWPLVRILFWTTLLGALDELLQYVWITRSYSDYLDFNDFLVNLIAACAGMMLYYGFRQRPAISQRSTCVEWCVVGAITLAATLGMGLGKVVVYPERIASPSGVVQTDNGSQQFWLQQGPSHYGGHFPGKRHPTFFVLPPWAGLLLMLLVGAVFSRFPWVIANHRSAKIPPSPPQAQRLHPAPSDDLK